jgi:hypothetical protein
MSPVVGDCGLGGEPLDVTGKWLPLGDKRPSRIIDGWSKWIGPMWSQIDEHLILRYTPAKTQFTSGAKVDA